MRSEAIIPGSDTERRVVRELWGKLKEFVDEVHYLEIPVYSWNHNCRLVVDGREVECIHIPYTARFEGRISPEKIVYIDKSSDSVPENLVLKDRVVFIQYPQSYTDLRLVVYELARRRPELIVLVSGEHLKSDVVLSSPGVSDLPSLPLPVCVISIPFAVARIAAENGFELLAGSRVSTQRGIILVSRINGSGENEIHLATHHDTILGGFETTSSSILDRILMKLKEANARPNIVAISYTSREIGDYMFTEYHFGWGERYLLRLAEAKGQLERVVYALAIGPIHRNNEIVVHAHPALSTVEFKNELIKNVDFNQVFTESDVYSRFGIPAITFTTLPGTWHLHNTSPGVRISDDLARKLSDLLLYLLSKVRLDDNWFHATRKVTYTILGEPPLESRITVSRLFDVASLHGRERGLKELTRTIYGRVEIACLNPLKTEVFSGIGVSISRSVINAIKSALENCLSEVMLSTRESTSILLPERGSIAQYLNSLTEYWLKRLDTLVEQMTLKAQLGVRGKS